MELGHPEPRERAGDHGPASMALRLDRHVLSSEQCGVDPNGSQTNHQHGKSLCPALAVATLPRDVATDYRQRETQAESQDADRPATVRDVNDGSAEEQRANSDARR